MAEQLTLDDYEKTLRFDGETFDTHLDFDRLARQTKIVYLLMIDGQWRSLAEIEAATGEPQASISARLRDFRKPRFGSHIVDRRRRGKSGTWEYMLTRRKVQQ